MSKIKKRFKEGDIVYWCKRRGHNYSVEWGMVDEHHFASSVVVDYLVPVERRMVDGIPIDEFESDTKFKKLPRGWSYDTKLFELSWRDYTEEEKFLMDGIDFDVANPDTIRLAYESGLLVKKEDIFSGSVRDEVTKDGYKIVKYYEPYGRPDFNHTSIRPSRLYDSYQEAQDEVNRNVAELHRQANLSEYDWSVEQIDEVLNRWAHTYNQSDKTVKAYRDWILDIGDEKTIEDIEVRTFGGKVQWKHWKRKRWNNIEL